MATDSRDTNLSSFVVCKIWARQRTVNTCTCFFQPQKVSTKICSHVKLAWQRTGEPWLFSSPANTRQDNGQGSHDFFRRLQTLGKTTDRGAMTHFYLIKQSTARDSRNWALPRTGKLWLFFVCKHLERDNRQERHNSFLRLQIPDATAGRWYLTQSLSAKTERDSEQQKHCHIRL